MKLENAVQPSYVNEKRSLTYEQLSRAILISVPVSPTSASFRELPLIRTLRFKLMHSKKIANFIAKSDNLDTFTTTSSR